jgi:cytochrome bd-type quinol oxidase subunit 2
MLLWLWPCLCAQMLLAVSSHFLLQCLVLLEAVLWLSEPPPRLQVTCEWCQFAEIEAVAFIIFIGLSGIIRRLLGLDRNHNRIRRVFGSFVVVVGISFGVGIGVFFSIFASSSSLTLFPSLSSTFSSPSSSPLP